MSFVSTTENYSNENCAICLEPLIDDVWEHTIHRFHGRCITDWVKANPTCPTCRAQVDAVSLLGYKVLFYKGKEVLDSAIDLFRFRMLLNSEEMDDLDLEMPEVSKKFMVVIALCTSPLLIYDIAVNGNLVVIGAGFWAGTALFISTVAQPIFDIDI